MGLPWQSKDKKQFSKKTKSSYNSSLLLGRKQSVTDNIGSFTLCNKRVLCVWLFVSHIYFRMIKAAKIPVSDFNKHVENLQALVLSL